MTLEDEDFIQKTIQEHYRRLHWSEEEKCVKIRSKFKLPNLDEVRVPISLALKIKSKNSCFGRFMETFNGSQNQNFEININKFGIEEWNIKHFDKREKRQWEYDHNFADDLFQFLKTAVHSEKCIDYSYFHERLTSLRLIDCQINYFDSMRQFANLMVLILAGNWITNIDGKNLPRKLEFLECFMNEISNITTLCEKCPKRMKHLGFGRNKLSNDSCFHLLVDSGNFTELHTLDLSHNDIMDLTDLLQQLGGLQRLTALSLEGNPCYVCETYKNRVLNYFPKLLYLDETQILTEDRQKIILDENFDSSGLIFTCYRLIGIPMPPKGTNIVHTFYLEIEVPLLEEIESTVKIEEIKPSEMEEKVKEKPGKGDKKEKASEKSKKIPKSLKGKGLYALPDEQEIKTDETKTNFKTEEREWDTVMKFNNPAIIIATPDNNYKLLRDTFRSRVKVKIVYSQKYEEKTKKKEKGKKDSPAGDADAVILKKCTFATFYCDLKSVNWSDQYVDFIWADFPEIGKKAKRVEGSLKPEIYTEKGKGKEGKEKSSEKTSKETTVNKLPLPTTLTCHVGFGIKRHGQIQEIVSVKKGKKK